MNLKHIFPVVVLVVIFGMIPESNAALITGTNGHQYDIITGNYTWDQANDLVESMGQGYHLATITDQGEQDFVQGILSDYGGEFWLGAYQDPNETDPAASWSWVTGETWDYTNWQPGEPNDYMGLQEDHLGMWGAFDWRWNDEHGSSNIAGFVVELDPVLSLDAPRAAEAAPVPEPGTLLLLTTGLAGLGGLRRYWRRPL